MLFRKYFNFSPAYLAVAVILPGVCPGRITYSLPSTSPALTRSVSETAAEQAALRAPGDSVTRELNSTETQSFQLQLEKGQYLRVAVTTRGMAAAASFYGPDGQTLYQVACRHEGATPLSLVAESSGEYRLELRSLEREQARGVYDLRLDMIRSATESDKYHSAAEETFAEAEQLLDEYKAESNHAAIDKFKAALTLWRESDDPGEEAHTFKRIGDVYQITGDFQGALSYYKQALALDLSINNRRGEVEALNGLSVIYVFLGDNRTALRCCTRALELSRVIGDEAGEALALVNIGEVRNYSGDIQKSLDFYSKALPIWEAIMDRRGMARTHLYLGFTYSDLGLATEAFDSLNKALSLWQSVDDRLGQAVTLTAIGRLYSRLGEGQESLDFFNKAMQLMHQIGDPLEEARVLNGIAYTYNGLGEKRLALEYYEEALFLYQSTKYEGIKNTLYDIGSTYLSLGDYEKALDYYLQDLSLSESTADRREQAYAFQGLGMVYDAWGKKEQALGQYLGALPFYRAEKDLRGEGDTLNLIGRIYEDQGRGQQARECYNRALAVSRAAEYPFGETATRYNLARVERAGGDLNAARAQAEAALSLVESLRTKVASQDLRASYFASVRQLYELYIDLLMEAHRQYPDEGYDAAAFEASERARARSLLETLAAARVGVREKVAPELLEREHALRNELDQKIERRIRLHGDEQQQDAAALIKEIDELSSQYHEVDAQVRAAGAEFTAQSQPQPLGLSEIRARDLDDDTLLLEFSLGEERSYLWVVSKDALQTYELPPRAKIEEAANRARNLLVAPAPVQGETFDARQARMKEAEDSYWREATTLSEMLLAQAASSLGTKRLLVVADGSLQYIPFSALPVPRRDEPTPLLVEHEVTSQPSASALATLRDVEAVRRPATAKTVAVFADPVFEADDSRLEVGREASGETAQAQASETELHRALRDVGAAWAGGSIPRLPASREEAEAIVGATTGADNLVKVGFDADKATATSPELSGYRIIHFATHGVLDSEHPELSGLLLSRFDRGGRPKEGFLRLDDIYNLNLPAELVVLSACDTGLGKDVRGEGLVGLVRGFMYAGSSRVVASLWKVDDDATAELMTHFYREMLQEQKSPAAALRAAQIAMWQQRRWHAPYYWAAFVLQGEYGGKIEIGRSPRMIAPWPAGVAALVISLCCLYAWRRRARRKIYVQ
jgi:CHAT domain-containing protein